MHYHDLFIDDGYCVLDRNYLSINKELIENDIYRTAIYNFHEVLQIIEDNKLDFGIGVKYGNLNLHNNSVLHV